MASPAPQPAAPDASSGPELFCPSCGYSLRGIDSERCPECGFYIDRSAAAVSRIPWEHRRRLGLARAYWRTLRMPTREIARDMARPVNYRDARLFQLVTVLLSTFPLAALTVLPLPNALYAGLGNTLSGWPMTMPPGWALDLMLPLLAGAGLRVLPVAIVLYFMAMTGVASYFFHPPHLTIVQQNRAVALSYYAAAPLVLLLIPGMIAWVFVLLHVRAPGGNFPTLLEAPVMGLVMALVPVLALLVLWIGTLRMLRHATLCSTARVFSLAVTLPLAWVGLAVLILIGLPWMAGFAMIVYWSLR